MKKEDLVYFPNGNYNGVLIVLREPHKKNGETAEEAVLGNRIWFEKVLSDQPMGNMISQYRNRFKEMLKICNENSLSSIAFTNINPEGGGQNASNKYWKMNKAPIINDIIETAQPKVVFLLRELFEVITNDEPTKEGIHYHSGKTLRMAEIKGIRLYEIYHPSYRRKIKIDK